MNIFVLNKDPIKAARDHNDKHCVKMILESAQLLCTTQQLLSEEECDPIVYRPVFKNHPCTIWARENDQNYLWLFKLFLALIDEYERRYKRDHKCKELIPFLKNPPAKIKKSKKITPFALAMPKQYQHKNAVVAYRAYYVGAKAKISTWKHSKTPAWYIRNLATAQAKN